MAVPKKRTSKARKRSRRANWKLDMPALTKCPHCHQIKLAHRICKECGYYDGRKIIDTAEEKARAKKAKAEGR